MNIKSNLSLATTLYKEENYSASISICNKLVKKKPNLFGAIELLALNYQKTNKINKAIELFDKAILLKPKSAIILNSVGNLYLQRAEYNKASTYFKKSIALSTSSGKALGNLAVCQHYMGEFEAAEKSFKKAILHDAKSANFHLNLGKLYLDIGYFDSALTFLLKSLELDPTQSPIYFHIYTVMMCKHRYQDALEVADMGILSHVLSDIELCELLVGKAIVFWLFGRIEEANQALNLSVGLYLKQNNYVNIVNLTTFHRYLKQLTTFRLNNNVDFYQNNENHVNELFFISESHCLSPSGVNITYKKAGYKIRSLFVQGAKVYHFSNNENNKYKASLVTLLDGLPDKSKVVLGFGEIDCRHNEGIFKQYLKTKQEIIPEIKKMIDNYINYLLELNQHKQHEFIIYGVPAPHPNQVACLPTEHQEEFKTFIACFNNYLANKCVQLQISFLDIYLLTNQNKQSNLKYHIDEFHVGPEAIPAVFNQ